VPASTVFLDHSHSAARLPSASAVGRAPQVTSTSASAFGFPKFTFRTSNSIASSAPRPRRPRPPTLFNPFPRSAPKAAPLTPAAVATQNTATQATSGLNFGSFYFFPEQYFSQQQPQYSAIIDFNPKTKPLHRPQARYPAATKLLLSQSILPPPPAATVAETEENIAEPRFLEGNSLDYEIFSDGDVGVIDTIAPPPTASTRIVIPPGRFKIYDALDPLAVPIE